MTSGAAAVAAGGGDKAISPAAPGPAATAPDRIAVNGEVGNVLTLEVRRVDTRELVPFAELQYGPLAENAEGAVLRLDQPAWRGIERVPAAARRALRADANGRAALSMGADDLTLITARKDGLYGETCLTIWRQDLFGTPVLWVDRDCCFHVQVFDAIGAPQGRQLVLLGHEFEASGHTARVQCIVGATAADGLLAVAHAQVPLTAPGSDRLPVRRAWVALADAGSVGPAAAIDLQQPPTDAVRLILPASGRIVCRVEPELCRGQRLYLQLVDGPELPALSWQLPLDAAGRAVFPRVALGVRYRAYLPYGMVVGDEFDGPQRQGDEVVFDLQPQAGLLRMRARLLQQGVPLAQRQVTLHMLCRPCAGSETTVQQSVRSDDDGHCTWLLDGRLREQAVAHALITADGEAPQPQAVLALQQLAPGTLDLGDLELQAPAALFAGSIVFGDGSPCPRAMIACEPAESAVPDPRLRRALGRDLQVRVTGSRFAVFGPGGARAYSIVCTSPFGPESMLESPPGKLDLQVGVRRAAHVIGTVRLAARCSDPPRAFTSRLLPVPGTGAVNGCGGIHVLDPSDPQRVSVRFLNVEPGRYDAEFRLTAQPDVVLLRIGDVEVKAGTSHDPRLADLLLGGREVRVEAVDVDGKLLQLPITVAVRRQERGPWRAVRGTGAVAVVVAGDADAWVGVEGFAAQVVALDQAVVHVLMVPDTRTVRVRITAPALPPGVRLLLHCEPRLTPELQQPIEREQMGSLPAAHFLGIKPGEHELSVDGTDTAVVLPRLPVALRVALRTDARSVDLGELTPTRLDGSEDAGVELRAPEASWQLALRALR